MWKHTPVVHNILSVEAALVPQVPDNQAMFFIRNSITNFSPVKLQVDVLDDLLEGVGGVDGVPKAWRVHHCQPQLHSPLLDLHSVRVDLNCSFHPDFEVEQHEKVKQITSLKLEEQPGPCIGQSGKG